MKVLAPMLKAEEESSPGKLEPWLVQARVWKGWIDQGLQFYSELGPESPEILTEAMRYSLLAPGKRLRPLLTLAACEMCGGRAEQAMPAACAIEMIHAYSLVHDDLPGMDNDDFRRGRPTCHIQYNHATAILVGDSLQSLAFQILAEAANPDVPRVSIDGQRIDPLSVEVALKCLAELARAAGPMGMAGGQQDDLLADRLPRSEASLERIHRRKTGALLATSLKMGGIVAGVPDRELENLWELGQNIGLAFQITDDLLDVTGDAQQVGKQTQKDSQQGKLTYPGLFGVDESQRKAQALIRRAYDSLERYGCRATVLQGLARFILERQQ
ncbi:MAG: polyprenyl synthetase family protein [Planctomycetaceae bacterium]|nr:polyprenyl synthetase family protein [Planctomycetaceae bacterium]